MHKEILSKEAILLLDKLKKIKSLGFYLAGGTSLALQIGHRKSIDFDFFIKGDINTEKLYLKCFDIFDGFNIKKIFEEENTLYIVINGVKISFFGYKFDLIDSLIDNEYFYLASKKDLIAMKLLAITHRGTNKDYFDLFFLIKEFGLESCLKFAKIKFNNGISDNLILKALVYFDDIKKEKLDTIIKISMKEVFNYMISLVKNN